MRRLLIIVLVTLLCTIGWWFGARWVFPSTMEAYWIQDLYRQHTAMAEKITGPRIFILAGSSTLYGYSAERMSAVIGTPVINFGAQAGLGVSYMTSRLQPLLRKGDTVIVAFESSSLIVPTIVTENVVGYAQFYDPLYFRKIPLREWPYLLVGSNPVQVINGTLVSMLVPRTGGEPLNASGDSTHNRVDAKTPAMLQGFPSITYVLPLQQSPSHALGNFVREAQAKGVKLYATWPPLMDREKYHADDYQTMFKAIARQYTELGMTVLGRQEDFFLPEARMFDTEYHADAIGRDIETKRLLKFYCAQAHCARRP